jgi:hypothetical protein
MAKFRVSISADDIEPSPGESELDAIKRVIVEQGSVLVGVMTETDESDERGPEVIE